MEFTMGANTTDINTGITAVITQELIDNGTQINPDTLQVLQQDPDTLSIPNTNKQVKQVKQILLDETTTQIQLQMQKI